MKGSPWRGHRRRSEGQTSSSASIDSDDGGQRRDGTANKWPKIHSSFRISPLVEVFASFTEVKKRILTKMNFDGLMHLPKGETDSDRPFKLTFSFWLLTKLNSHNGRLELGERGTIPIETADVTLVMGLPCGGEEVDVPDPAKLESNKNIIKKNLLLGGNDELDLESVKRVLQRPISDESDYLLAEAFMTAVVIYAVSYFLAPKGRPPKINTDIFDSITEPQRIMRINWASYVLKTLREASAKIKSDMLAGKCSVCLDGCLLFLQIVYLDNIRFESGSATNCIVPRIGDFNYEKLNNLIKRDKLRTRQGGGEQFGRFEILQASETCYTWGLLNDNMEEPNITEKETCSEKMTFDMVVQYIDQKKYEQNKKIRKEAMEFAEKLCSASNKKFEELKAYVCKSMSQKGSNGEGPDQKSNKRTNQSDKVKPNKSDSNRAKPERKSETDDGSKDKREESMNRSQTEKEPEIIDLTGDEHCDDGSAENEPPQKKDSNPNNLKNYSVHIGSASGPTDDRHKNPAKETIIGMRKGTKRCANRTPIAVRKRLIATMAGKSREQHEDAMHHNTNDSGGSMDLHKGKDIASSAPMTAERRKKVRTKHPAHKKLKGKNYTVDDEYQSTDEEDAN